MRCSLNHAVHQDGAFGVIEMAILHVLGQIAVAIGLIVACLAVGVWRAKH
jgi:hypothetical protein